MVQPVGPFHIASDNRTVVEAKGRKFISYGTTVPGLSNPNLTSYPSGDLGKIDATANYWCGNTPTGLSDGICGPAENYQGMDAVAYHIRVDGNATKNLLWVEGPGAAGTLAGLAQPDCGPRGGRRVDEFRRI